MTEILSPENEVINVALGARAYDIVVGVDVLAQAADHVRPVLSENAKVAIVTDETVAKLHLPALVAALDGDAIAHAEIVLPPGEAAKSFQQLERIVDQLLEARIERGDAIIALGGGVVGDLAGFAAAVLRRGVDVIQAPTTLLAQVDSSVGGKTAINTRFGKNLVGAFHQPRLVLADISVLASLPAREMRAGYAEAVKYGLIDDAELFAWYEANGQALLAGDQGLLAQAVINSCRAKARIVAEDEREHGRRALLNLGHTFGHALEAEMGYGDGLLHGEAVSIGMRMAFDFSARLDLCPAADALRVRRHLEACALPTTLADVPGGAQAGANSGRWNAQRLLDHMRQDKKVVGGALTFILAAGIGRSFVTREVAEQDVLAALGDEIAAAV
jgi:3-dehydroquinate synthase